MDNMLNVAIWVQFIMENLFKDNEFLNKCYIADSHVKEGKYVVIPQAGGKPNVVKNRTSLPAAVTKRTDTSIVYPIDEYTTDPMRIDNAEQYELSYDKMASIMGEQLEVLREVTADNMIYEWLREYAFTNAGTAVAAPVLRTTGAASAEGLVDGATGTRLILTPNDLKAAQKYMNKQNVPKGDRYALLSSEMYGQLLEDPDLKKRDRAMEIDLKDGIVAKLYGFNLIERSQVISYDNAGTPVVKAPGTVAAITDNDAAIFWQKNHVERAVGTIDLFNDQRSPIYYGDIVSALVRMGGRKRRINSEGLLSIVQAHGA